MSVFAVFSFAAVYTHANAGMCKHGRASATTPCSTQLCRRRSVRNSISYPLVLVWGPPTPPPRINPPPSPSMRDNGTPKVSLSGLGDGPEAATGDAAPHPSNDMLQLPGRPDRPQQGMLVAELPSLDSTGPARHATPSARLRTALHTLACGGLWIALSNRHCRVPSYLNIMCAGCTSE